MRFRFCGDLDCPDWVLAEIATLSKLTSARIKLLVNQIISYCVQGEFNYDKVIKLANDLEGFKDLKGAIAAVHFIITNASKHDLDEQSLIQEIQQLGLPKENSDALGIQYREHKELLRTSFANNSYRLSKVISTEWRVDQILASSNTPNDETGLSVQLNIQYDSRPQDGVISNNISLDTERIKNAAFDISPEKLDLLVYELSNATKFLESINS